MGKTILVLILIVMGCSPANAFSYQASLAEQTGVQYNLSINAEGLSLARNGVKSIKSTPNYANDREIFVTTSDNNHYWNNQFEPNFTSLTKIPLACTQSFCIHAFIDDYENTGYQLYATGKSIYLSLDRGQTWKEYQTEVIGEIEGVDFGPRFITTNLLFITTGEGLFKYNIDTKKTEIVFENESDTNSIIFRDPFKSRTERIYFVSNGSKLFKTEDGGQTWMAKEFTNGIKLFDIVPNGNGTSRVILITTDNKLMFADYNMEFYNVALPKTLIINRFDWIQENNDAVLYFFSTDQGFYYSYDKCNSWTNRQYNDMETITDYRILKSGIQYLLFLIIDGSLYRDIDFSDKLIDYNLGINFNYANEGEAISRNVLEFSNDTFSEDYQITEATTLVDSTLNNQLMSISVSADGGITWEPTLAGEIHTFIEPGRDLRWKVNMSTNDLQSTPILRSISIEYGVDKIEKEDDVNCAGFTDVLISDHRCESIKYVKNAEIFDGYPDGTFKPEQPINRVETVKVISEGFGLELIEDDNTNLGFHDVIIGEWYMTYLATAKQEGIIKGYPDGTFKPEQTVNYIEMLKIFFETADVQLPAITENEQWYERYLQYAKDHGLLQQEEIIAPMTRGDVAQLFYEWNMQNS